MIQLTVNVTDRVSELLDEFVKTELFGDTREVVGERLIADSMMEFLLTDKYDKLIKQKQDAQT